MSYNNPSAELVVFCLVLSWPDNINIGERDETSECADTVKVCWNHCGVVLLVVAVVWCGVVWCSGPVE